jgi:hypothetical protein
MNKTERLSNWNNRPLSAAQLTYASIDVHSLLGIISTIQKLPFLLSNDVKDAKGKKPSNAAAPVNSTSSAPRTPAAMRVGDQFITSFESLSLSASTTQGEDSHKLHRLVSPKEVNEYSRFLNHVRDKVSAHKLEDVRVTLSELNRLTQLYSEYSANESNEDEIIESSMSQGNSCSPNDMKENASSAVFAASNKSDRDSESQNLKLENLLWLLNSIVR